MRNLFFDYNSTTPVREEVLKEMLSFFSHDFGNPSSIHKWGQKGREAVESSRSKVARLLGAEPEEIIFTSGGSEANSMALLGSAFPFLDRKGHIVISSIEHPSVLKSAAFLESLGFRISKVDPDPSGVVQPERVSKEMQEDTFLVSIMHSNNETGALQPVADISRTVKNKGIAFHTDAVQSAGKVTVDAAAIGSDLISLSAHKFYGPKGIGALFLKRGTRLSPLIFGGGQEMGMRGGTEMVPQIVGLGVAAEYALHELDSYPGKISAIRDEFERKIAEEIEGVKINAVMSRRLPNTSNIVLKSISSESLMISLDLEGCGVSAGSACHSGTVEPSRVLLAMGVSKEDALSSLRISFGRQTSLKDALLLADLIKKKVHELRA